MAAAPEPVPLERPRSGPTSARSLAVLSPALEGHPVPSTQPGTPSRAFVCPGRVLVPVAASALPSRCPRPGSGRPLPLCPARASPCALPGPPRVLHRPPDKALTSGWPSARLSPQQRPASALLRSWGCLVIPALVPSCVSQAGLEGHRGGLGVGGAKVGGWSPRSGRRWEPCPYPAPARSAAGPQLSWQARSSGVGPGGRVPSPPHPPLRRVQFLLLRPGAWAALAQPRLPSVAAAHVGRALPLACTG